MHKESIFAEISVDVNFENILKEKFKGKLYSPNSKS